MEEYIDEDYIAIFSMVIISIIVIVSVCIVWYVILPTTKEKHVHFADEYSMDWKWKEWKHDFMSYIKRVFFKSRVENGILKTTRYTSDSEYAKMFE